MFKVAGNPEADTRPTHMPVETRGRHSDIDHRLQPDDGQHLEQMLPVDGDQFHSSAATIMAPTRPRIAPKAQQKGVLIQQANPRYLLCF